MNKLRERAKELNIPCRHKMSREELEKAIKDTTLKYKELIFTSDVVCKDCLNELRKQDMVDKYQHAKKLMEQTIRDFSWEYITEDGEMLVDNKTGEVIGPLVDSTYYKEKF